MEAYAECLSGDKGREERRQRLPLVVVSTADARTLKIPDEVVKEVFKEGTSFFEKMFGDKSKKRVKARKQPVTGLAVTTGAPDLSNLAATAAEVERVSFIR